MRRGSTDSKSWSHRIKEVTVSAQVTDTFLDLDIKGGADNGQFCYINSVDEKKCVFWHATLVPQEVILEVQGHKVSGFTLRDIKELIQALTKNGAPIMIKTVPLNSLASDLRTFLSSKFKLDSPDYALQATIRDNLYLRTVPVTTRPRRDGEVDGVDYSFLTPEKFLNLEKSGKLLESGIFEGNYYGTPKPSPDATGLFRKANGDSPSGDGKLSDLNELTLSLKRQRTRSTTDAMDNGNGVAKDTPNTNRQVMQVQPLPASKNSTPSPQSRKGSEPSVENPLPPGWERVSDPKYGVFYIDHINKKTQYDAPTAPAVLSQSKSYTNGLSYSTSSSSLLDHSLHNNSSAIKFPGNSPPASYTQDMLNSRLTQQIAAGEFGPVRIDPIFTPNPTKLIGENQTVQLTKSPRGFGFIITGGGDRRRPEFLQIKSIVPGAPAEADGRLRPGDVIVYVNETLVLGYTHEDIIGLFQQMEVGVVVSLTVNKGYRLPLSASDPQAEVVTKHAVSSVNGDQQSQRSSHSSSGLGSPGSLTSPTLVFPDSKPQLIKAVIVRSSTGFGFTIADSPQGQRIRQIFDKERCRILQTGDLVIEVNHQRVKETPHADVVRLLSECPVGTETTFLLQRGGVFSATKFKPSVSMSSGLASIADEGPSTSAPTQHSLSRPPPAASIPTSMPQVPPSASTNSFFSRHQPLRSSRPEQPTTVITYNPGDSIDDRFRSRTPNPELSGSHLVLNSDPLRPKAPTGLEARHRSASNLLQPSGSQDFLHNAVLQRQANSYGSLGRRLHHRHQNPSPPVQMTVTLTRNNLGLGIHIVGGSEEGSQVAVGKLVPGSAADIDGRIQTGDEILTVNGSSVWGASHHRVVELMESSVPKVALGLRRPHVMAPYKVTVTRRPEEGFGFVIVSSVTRQQQGGSAIGEFIGHIIEGSPASRCGRLKKGDRLLAVNDCEITKLHHEDIVQLIRDSGLSVCLTIGPPGETNTSDTLPPAKSRLEPDSFEILLHKSDRGFGFSIRGGAEFNRLPFHVLRIAEDGAAAMDGRLRIGDELLAINGRAITGITHADAINVIRSAGDTLRLRVRRPTPS